jgi:hypothetical protein
MKLLFFILLTCICSISYAQQNTTADSSITPQKHTSQTASKAPWWVQRFTISAGGFIPTNNTNVKVGNSSGGGSDIDFENDLGFTSSTTTFIAGGEWRASKRSRFNFNYYNINRSATHTLQKDIQFADTTYHANATIQAFFNTAIYQVSYGYALLSKPKYELGLMVGAHLVDFSVGLGVVSSIGSVSGNKDFNTTAPLPDLGIWGGYAFSDHFAFNGAFSYLSLAVDNVKGQIVSYNASITYKAAETFSLALGYTGLNFDVDATTDKLHGAIKWGYNGPSFTANFSFGKKKW